MSYYRTIRTVGLVRQFRAVEADRKRTDPDEPPMKRPSSIIFNGSWGDYDKPRFYRDRKAPRLAARRTARQHRERQRQRLI